jgi:sister-chromatid-cohesion protein PDS5
MISTVTSLGKKKLWRHTYKEIKLKVTSCLSEIMRISTPKAPHDENTMKEIFQWLVDSFQGSDDVTCSEFTRRVTILETFSKIIYGNIMIHMGLNDLILKMFHQFFATIKEYHASIVITAMHSIMTLIVNESDEVLQSLYYILLTNMLEGDKKIIIREAGPR